jgi:hypothetical protein
VRQHQLRGREASGDIDAVVVAAKLELLVSAASLHIPPNGLNGLTTKVSRKIIDLAV